MRPRTGAANSRCEFFGPRLGMRSGAASEGRQRCAQLRGLFISFVFCGLGALVECLFLFAAFGGLSFFHLCRRPTSWHFSVCWSGGCCTFFCLWFRVFALCLWASVHHIASAIIATSYTFQEAVKSTAFPACRMLLSYEVLNSTYLFLPH